MSIDAVLAQKLDALGVMISQFAEGGANGSAELYPDDPAKQRERQRQVRENFARRFQATVARFGGKLAEWYPGGAAKAVQHAEAFEVCEYGGQPDKAELKRLFPFF